MAAGATIGSNHNSRAPDGEIEAGRGFWPGLCTSVKHSSRFASFCLLSKGDYRFELNIPFPFCLVDNDYKHDRLVLSPGYWWTSNMYALMRNEAKFLTRDNRYDKTLHFEYSPFAPDTSEEILSAIALLEELTGRAFESYHKENPTAQGIEALVTLAETFPEREGRDGEAILDKATVFAGLGRAILGETKDPLPFEVKAEHIENSSRECLIRKPVRAWRAYKEMLLWFAGREIARFAAGFSLAPKWETLAAALPPDERSQTGIEWENLGGLLAAKPRLEGILANAEAGAYSTWHEFHEEYKMLSDSYRMDKTRYAWSLLGHLYPPSTGKGPSKEGLLAAFRDLEALSFFVGEGVYESRAKDWSNPFRKATYKSNAEMMAVLGNPSENSFVKRTREEMEVLRKDLRRLSEAL